MGNFSRLSRNLSGLSRRHLHDLISRAPTEAKRRNLVRLFRNKSKYESFLLARLETQRRLYPLLVRRSE